MSAVWVVGGLAAVAAVIALIASWRRGPRADLGTVSSQWISEHRLGSNQDFVRRAVQMVRELGLEPATPQEARAMTGLA